MAKKSNDNSNSLNIKESGTFKGFFKDDRFKISFGIFLFLVALFLIISFISYFSTWQSDQNILNKSLFKILFSNNQVDNLMGSLGAYFSNLFIHNLFGIGSFAIVFLLVFFGLLLFDYKPQKRLKIIICSVIFMLWISVAAATFFSDNFFSVGGAYGYFIYSWLRNLVGKISVFALVFLSLFLIIIFTFEKSLPWTKNKIYELLKKKTNIVDNQQDTKQKTKDTNSKKAEKSEEAEEPDNDFVLASDFGDNKNVKDKFNSNGVEIEIAEDESFEEEPFENIDYKNVPKQKHEQKDLSLEVHQSKEEFLEDDEFNQIQTEDYDPTKDLEYYKLPPIELLQEYASTKGDISDQELKENSDKIVKTLLDYKIGISKIRATIGPTVTLYEIIPAPGIKISKIKSLEDDIALSLAALGIRIEAPIPGKGTIGIEVPNSKPEIVSMRSVLVSEKFQNTKYELPVAMGKTIANETYVFNLAKTPHLLMAGATGQGKSVGVNAIITSLLYKKHPSQLKFVLIDPKMVELSLYNKIEKNFLAKLPNDESAIITDVTKVVPIMNSLCILMDERYKLLTTASVRNITEYNEKFIHRKLNPERGHYYMPYIVVVVDEFADIIVQEGKQIEAPISRLAAKARAIGIHLIVATQRPSTDVITGVIKANFPTRVAFKVTNIHDSKTILDQTGANQLIGKGDMLISDAGKITRLQCAFIDTPEVEDLVNYIGEQQSYVSALELPEPSVSDSEGGGGSNFLNPNERDELFIEAAHIIVRHQQGSTSLIQRKMSLGYNRAGRIMDQLEAAGVVGPNEGSKARQVLFADEYSLEQYLNSL